MGVSGLACLADFVAFEASAISHTYGGRGAFFGASGANNPRRRGKVGCFVASPVDGFAFRGRSMSE